MIQRVFTEEELAAIDYALSVLDTSVVGISWSSRLLQQGRELLEEIRAALSQEPK